MYQQSTICAHKKSSVTFSGPDTTSAREVFTTLRVYYAKLSGRISAKYGERMPTGPRNDPFNCGADTAANPGAVRRSSLK